MRTVPGLGRLRMPTFRFLSDRPLLRIRHLLSALFRSLSRLERWLLAVFLLGALISGTQLAWSSENTTMTPVAGGVYREGLLGTSVRDLEGVRDALTKVGLLKLGMDGLLTGDLGSEWTISEDGQTIRVRLRDGIDADTIVTTLRNQSGSGYWKEAEISTPEAQIVQFQLNKPWAGFAAELVTPIFPYGPFVAEDSDDPDVAVYVRNPRALKSPYIDRLEIHLFTDSKALERAARKNAIDGVFNATDVELTLPDSWRVETPLLAREYVLFFNTRQEALQDQAIREKLANNQRLDAPLALRLAVPEGTMFSTLAGDLAFRWEALNVQVTVEEYPLLTLTKTVVPERNYDLLLLGIDYGPDKDLYPYWHSSQIAAPGNNLAGYRDKEIDRILDETRKIPDQAARQEKYQVVREHLLRDSAFISLGSPSVTVGFSPRLKGESPDSLPTLTSRFTDLASWYMKERQIPTPTS